MDSPSMTPSKVPACIHHKGSGQAIVKLGGRVVYLGAFGSEAAQHNYRRVVAEWQATGGQVAVAVLTVDHVIAGYWQHAETYYRKDGRPTSELSVSSVHISSPQKPGTIRIAVGGSNVRLCGDPMEGVTFGGERGVVRGFSKASRRRMLQFLQSVDREKCGMPLFVTLTYRGEWPGDPRRWKRDLTAWLARLKRRDPAVWAVWRLEPQRRGAPHYHLLVFGTGWLDKEWLSRTWFEVVGSRDERHLRAGTQVQLVQSWRRVIGYAAKYLAKEVDELPAAWWQGVGRWWGVHR